MVQRQESASLLSAQTIFPSHYSITIWICTLLLEIFLDFLSSIRLKFPRHHNIPTSIRPCFDFRHHPPDFALQTFLSAAAVSQRDLCTLASSLPISFDAVATSLQCKIIMFSAILKLLIFQLTHTALSRETWILIASSVVTNQARGQRTRNEHNVFPKVLEQDSQHSTWTDREEQLHWVLAKCGTLPPFHCSNIFKNPIPEEIRGWNWWGSASKRKTLI